MIISHCYNILVNGVSPYSANEYVGAVQVYDYLKTGVKVRRLDSLKSALFMIELLRLEQQQASASDVARYFDNFISWSFSHLPIEMTLALVKYAIKDRGFSIKKEVRMTESWQVLANEYKPILLVPDATAQKSPVYRKMMRYARSLSAATTNARIAIDSDTPKPKRRKVAKKTMELEAA